MQYASVVMEGGFFPIELLDLIAAGDIEGQKAADFGLDGKRRLIDEMQSSFSAARAYWEAFQKRLERSKESATTITREYWIYEFLELLGFPKLEAQRASTDIGIYISHRAGADPNAPPVHIVDIDQDIDDQCPQQFLPGAHRNIRCMPCRR